MSRYDVIIIGGSLAGAACARELERKGIEVLALERDYFPRRKVCGGFLSPGAVQCIGHLGLLNKVLDAGAVQVRSARVRAGSVDIDIPFECPGLGISRRVLDTVFAEGTCVQQGYTVQKVHRCAGGFSVDAMHCRVVIDATGKLGRFTKRRNTDDFGVQYTEPQSLGGVLDFWFFEDRYGGGVSIEGGESNFCFLVKKDALPKYLDRPGCLVTGPLAYDRLPGDFIAIGDAGGMLDPFSGEGMRHAMETGMLAARIVAVGLRRQAAYEEMKWEYEAECQRRWALRRALGAGMRRVQKHFSTGLKLAPKWLVNRIWY